MQRPGRVTLAVISKELNLSTSSVSRALRNDPLIHPATRAQVNAAAARLGYQGRSRRGPQAAINQRVIRVLFSGSSLTDIKSGPITTAYLQGMTAEAEAANAFLSIHAIPYSSSKKTSKEIPSMLNHGEGDVLIVIGGHDPAMVAKLAQVFPTVSLVRSYEGVTHDLISTDDIGGIGQLVKRLAELGHRKLGWVNFDDKGYYTRSRHAGFLSGCLAEGLDIADQVQIGGIFSEGELVRPRPILDAVHAGVTAFVAASDHAAYEVSKVLTDAKIAIPEDVSVTGFDAIGEPGHQSFSFTSCDPQFVEMGRAAVRQALWRLENLSAAPVQVTIRGQIVSGATIAAAKSRGGRGRRAA